MPYQWPLDPQELFIERYPQMVNTGLPARGRGRDARRDHRHVGRCAGRVGVRVVTARSALCRGGRRGSRARSPTAGRSSPSLADDAKRRALKHQIEHYLLAAEDFPVDFDRRFLEVPYQGSSTSRSRARPGGARPPRGRARPDRQRRSRLVEDGPPRPVRRVRPEHRGPGVRVRHPRNRRVPDRAQPRVGGAWSRGCRPRPRARGRTGSPTSAYRWAATSPPRPGWPGSVDAAIVLGGPVETAFAAGPLVPVRHGGHRRQRLRIRPPAQSARRSPSRRGAMSLRELLDQDTQLTDARRSTAPRTSISRRRTPSSSAAAGTRAVELLPDTGHCAVSKLDEVRPGDDRVAE